jgi:D-lactate dehydrogenase
VDPANSMQMEHAHACLQSLFAKVLALGGTLSGEHGIGTEKRDYMHLEVDAPTMDLLRLIKAQFDPQGLLNPGKLLSR